MPGWATSLLVSVAVGIIMLLVNKLTTKSSAAVTKELSELKKAIEQLQKDGWSTEQKIVLERRFTLLESGLGDLVKEVDFTKASHAEFLRLLERALIPVAHSPHTPELDRLLEKRDRGEQLSAREWEELIQRLGDEAEGYAGIPGKQVAIRSLRAIYVAHLRQARRREEDEAQKIDISRIPELVESKEIRIPKEDRL